MGVISYIVYFMLYKACHIEPEYEHKQYEYYDMRYNGYRSVDYRNFEPVNSRATNADASLMMYVGAVAVVFYSLSTLSNGLQQE